MNNSSTTFPVRFLFTLFPKRLEIRLLVLYFCVLAAIGSLSSEHTFFNIIERNQSQKQLHINLPVNAGVTNAGLSITHISSTRPSASHLNAAVITTSSQPYVSAVRPANGATNVALDMSVSVDLMFPSGGSIDGSTVSPSTVRLYEIKGTQKQLVTGTAVNSSAAGDAVTLSASLTLNTTYEFEITGKVKDLKGYALIPFTSRFTTTNVNHNTKNNLENVAFTAQTLVTSEFGKDGFTTLVVGPDHRLYAATSGGKIERWDINADGTLENHMTISPFGTKRQLLIGLRFDPTATEAKLVAWMSHSAAQFENAQDWSSKITKIDLSNPSNPISQTYVTNLPRSYKDHSINSIDFGPDGALYVPIGSNTAMGGPSTFWDNRPERLLSAAILRLDITKAEKQTLPIDAKTPDGGGTYDPAAKDAPLTIYATGIRNAYDLVWHSNGQLYVPTNGSAAGGNTPELKSGTVWSNGKIYTGPDIPAITNVRDTQNDYLYRVVKGGYYGHPNSLRNEYILNGGNPTKGEDLGEVEWVVKDKTFGYTVGTPQEPNFRSWSYDFGLNISPNGVIEYKSNAFGGKLKGRLLVCRFSGGDDLIILEPNKSTKEITSAVEGIMIPGLRRPYANPLDVTEDERTGNLYISEYFEGNGKGVPQITLLKASVPAGINVPVDETTATLEVYPNPVPGTEVVAALQKFDVLEEVELTMLDMAGRKVQSQLIETDAQGAARTVIEITQNLQSGVYFIRAQSLSGKVVYKRIVVQ